MKNWRGDKEHRGFQQLLNRVATIVPPSVKPIRPRTLDGGMITLPALFLSVSSHETQLDPLEAIKALRIFGTKTVLVSAYDLLPQRRPRGVIHELRKLRKQGGIVLVDSGNYEASRLEDASWTPESFRQALKGIPHDHAFCFDVMDPSKNPSIAAKEVLDAVSRDSKFTKAPVFPIVHVPKRPSGGYNLAALPLTIRMIAEGSRPALIAIPERELGPGLLRRAETVKKIRAELNLLPFYQPIHLLGTGNPWSVAVLLAAGADSFDGLEWCRMAVDRGDDRLHHSQHFDFFTFQTSLANSAVTREALNDKNVDFAGKVAFHNLDYYMEFSDRLRESAMKNSFEALIITVIGKENAKQLKTEIPGIFG